MSQREIIDILKSKKDFLQKKFNVERIGLFGSYARNEEYSYSDVDILVKFRDPSYNIWCDVKKYLELNLNSPVDLITEGDHLSERFRNRIMKEVIYA